MSEQVKANAGFTLLEALVATAIVVSVTAAVMAVFNPVRGVFRSQPDAVELQQRLRMGIDALSHDLVNAGGGPRGVEVGGLLNQFAAILPFRRGRDPAIDDDAGVFRADAITILSVVPSAVQTTVRADMGNPSSAIAINAQPGCPEDDWSGMVDPLCGFRANVTRAAIFDGTGAIDTFAVSTVDEVTQSIGFQHPQQTALSKAYRKGRLSEVVSHVYYLNAATKQLLHYDGFSTVTPVLDNVVGLTFEYFGEAAPPVLVHTGPALSVTYGPVPPAVETSQGSFPPGANCAWQTNGGTRVSRLVPFGSGIGLVRLSPSELVDGPWCPDDVNERRYDADLFRIRIVRVTLRLRSTSELSADRSVTFDVSPRNLNLGR
jgi:hypothetical protein